MNNIQFTQSKDLGARVTRRPKHPYNIVVSPYSITPFLFAPVLPGETLQKLSIQSKAVSDPLDNGIIGWWKEFYFFYLPHRILRGADAYMSMMLNAEESLTASVGFQINNMATLPFHGDCYQSIVDNYFRYPAEILPFDFAPKDTNSLALARVNDRTFMDSAITASQMISQDFNVDLDADGNITASEVDQSLETWRYLKSNSMTDMTYEDYLRTYGVAVRKEISNKPELIRYLRDWTLPTNTVDPATGTPSSAVVWSTRETADKPRRFNEPGFIMGVTVVKPKIYNAWQKSDPNDILRNAASWLPSVMNMNPATSMIHFDADAGPLADVWTTVDEPDGYYIDAKDLFMHGCYYVNQSVTTNHKSAMDKNTSFRDYVNPLLDVPGFFKTPEARFIREDGIVDLTISTRTTDTSATTPIIEM